MAILTSLNSPLRIDTLPVAQGCIGMTICPGKKDPSAGSGHWDRDLAIDIETIRNWGASLVLTLLEDHEFERVKISQLPEVIQAAGMDWLHLRIRDQHAPDADFEPLWQQHGPQLQQRLERGEKILVHCMGGIGRTGTIVARLLLERGMPVEDAIVLVRQVRRGAIETAEQEAYLRALSISMA